MVNQLKLQSLSCETNNVLNKSSVILSNFVYNTSAVVLLAVIFKHWLCETFVDFYKVKEENEVTKNADFQNSSKY